MNRKQALKLLNLSGKLTLKQIKKAYRKMALKYHPDRTGGNDEMFKLISAAYDYLKDNLNELSSSRESSPNCGKSSNNYQYYNEAHSNNSSSEFYKKYNKAQESAFEDLYRDFYHNKDHINKKYTKEDLKTGMFDDWEDQRHTFFLDKFWGVRKNCFASTEDIFHGVLNSTKSVYDRYHNRGNERIKY